MVETKAGTPVFEVCPHCVERGDLREPVVYLRVDGTFRCRRCNGTGPIDEARDPDLIAYWGENSNRSKS